MLDMLHGCIEISARTSFKIKLSFKSSSFEHKNVVLIPNVVDVVGTVKVLLFSIFNGCDHECHAAAGCVY